MISERVMGTQVSARARGRHTRMRGRPLHGLKGNHHKRPDWDCADGLGPGRMQHAHTLDSGGCMKELQEQMRARKSCRNKRGHERDAAHGATHMAVRVNAMGRPHGDAPEASARRGSWRRRHKARRRRWGRGCSGGSAARAAAETGTRTATALGLDETLFFFLLPLQSMLGGSQRERLSKVHVRVASSICPPRGAPRPGAVLRGGSPSDDAMDGRRPAALCPAVFPPSLAVTLMTCLGGASSPPTPLRPGYDTGGGGKSWRHEDERVGGGSIISTVRKVKQAGLAWGGLVDGPPVCL